MVSFIITLCSHHYLESCYLMISLFYSLRFNCKSFRGSIYSVYINRYYVSGTLPNLIRNQNLFILATWVVCINVALGVLIYLIKP